MANLRLKKLILEVVDNQLRENNPPVTKESYDKLIDAGYSAREAKEKIGAIVKEKKVYPNDLCPCGSGKNIRTAVEEKSKWRIFQLGKVFCSSFNRRDKRQLYGIYKTKNKSGLFRQNNEWSYFKTDG